RDLAGTSILSMGTCMTETPWSSRTHRGDSPRSDSWREHDRDVPWRRRRRAPATPADSDALVVLACWGIGRVSPSSRKIAGGASPPAHLAQRAAVVARLARPDQIGATPRTGSSRSSGRWGLLRLIVVRDGDRCCLRPGRLRVVTSTLLCSATRP